MGSYKDSASLLEETQWGIYENAVRSYRNGNYDSAKSEFEYTNGISDTEKFLTLIKAREEPEYFTETDAYKDLLSLIGFEDTNDVILHDKYDILFDRFIGYRNEWGLRRKWTNSAGDYIEFTDEYCGSNLYNTSGKHYKIEKAVHYRGDNDSGWILEWKYSIISLNQIKVTRSNGRTVNLYR